MNTSSRPSCFPLHEPNATSPIAPVFRTLSWVSWSGGRTLSHKVRSPQKMDWSFGGLCMFSMSGFFLCLVTEREWCVFSCVKYWFSVVVVGDCGVVAPARRGVSRIVSRAFPSRTEISFKLFLWSVVVSFERVSNKKKGISCREQLMSASSGPVRV